MTIGIWIPAGFAAAALAVLAWEPAIIVRGFGEPMLPVAVHLLTAGVLLTSHYVHQRFRWMRLWTGSRIASGISAGVMGLHVAGTMLLVMGLLRGERNWAFAGGHYLLPTAVVVSWVGDLIWFRKHRKGERPGLSPLLPGIGLLVAVPLGVLLVMDRYTGQYGAYSPIGILLHALSGAFLFVLPFQASGRNTLDPAGVPGHGAARLMVIAGFGLLAIALNSHGLSGGLTMGLLLLGAVALWLGLPLRKDWSVAPGETWRDVGWAAFGLLLLWGALQARRGAGIEVGFPLAVFAGAWFLLGEAVPRALLELAALAGRRPESAAQPLGAGRWKMLAGRTRRLTGAGTILILAGQIAHSAGTARAGALLWLAALALLFAPAGWIRNARAPER